MHYHMQNAEVAKAKLTELEKAIEVIETQVNDTQDQIKALQQEHDKIKQNSDDVDLIVKELKKQQVRKYKYVSLCNVFCGTFL